MLNLQSLDLLLCIPFKTVIELLGRNVIESSLMSLIEVLKIISLLTIRHHYHPSESKALRLK